MTPGYTSPNLAAGAASAAEPAAAFVAVALLAVFAAFFVSAEVAVTRSAAMGIGQLSRQDRAARRLEEIVADPTRHLNLLLLLRVGCEVLAALSMAFGFVLLLGPNWMAFVVSAVFLLVIDYVLIGVTPRILGRQFSTVIALASANLLTPVQVVLTPVVEVLVRLGRGLTPRGKGDRGGPFSSEDELRRQVDLAERGHVIDAEERQMIHSVFKLDDTSVREVMVPRTDIVFTTRTSSLDDTLSAALRSGYSRIPVTGEDEDDVVGIVYLKDVVSWLREQWDPEAGAYPGALTADDVMREASYVPDAKPIDELLRDMQRKRTHLAVVIDEYGGTAGLVTIEDIVEEIVGEITDEYDDEVPPTQWLGPERARVTARLPLGELAELFGVQLDVPDVETVGGLLAYALGRVPNTGSEAVYAGLRLVAEDPARRPNRTTTILVERTPQAEGEQNADSAGA
ncbi:hemolysin family protein [Haloactinospora alba]|nr:hemolysin family protein [Haloactinospora alba]